MNGAPGRKILERARAVSAIVLDVDGVLTDGSIVFDDGGDSSRSFYVRDGSAIKVAMNEGIVVAILSGRNSEAVALRAKELGIVECVLGHRLKAPAFDAMLERLVMTDEQIAFMGDDFLDLPILRRVGLAAAPADASPEALDAAHWIASKPGGRGAVRELVELVLRAKGTWDAAIERALTP